MSTIRLVPASMSISVIGLPFGSYIGLASTSILEVLVAGYVAPEREDVGFAKASCPGAGDCRDLLASSGVAALTGDVLTALMRCGCLFATISTHVIGAGLF